MTDTQRRLWLEMKQPIELVHRPHLSRTEYLTLRVSSRLARLSLPMFVLWCLVPAALFRLLSDGLCQAFITDLMCIAVTLIGEGVRRRAWWRRHAVVQLQLDQPKRDITPIRQRWE